MTKTKTLIITGAVFVVLMGGILGASQLLASTSSSPAPKPPTLSGSSVSSAAPKTTPKTYTSPTQPTPTTSTTTPTPASTAPTYTPSKTPNQGTVQAQQPTTTTTSSGVSVSCNASMTSCNTQAQGQPLPTIAHPTQAQVDAYSWLAYPWQTAPPAVGSPAYLQIEQDLEAP